MKYIDFLINGLPLFAAILYSLTAIGFLIKRDGPWALVWFSYAMANIALVIVSRR